MNSFYLTLALIFVANAGASEEEKFFHYAGPSLFPGSFLGSFNPPAPAPAPTTSLPQFQADILAATNAKRGAECAGQVTQDAGLTNAAQAYAQQLANSGSFAHSPAAMGGQYGENLAMQCGAPLSGSAAVNGWYGEKRFFNKQNPQIIISGSNMNGHYTALVWKSTTRMGCGSATRGSCTYVVCNYLQPGNNPATVGQEVGC